MKIRGKSSIISQLQNLPAMTPNQLSEISSLASQNSSVVSVDVQGVLSNKVRRTHSVKFINYVEPYTIKGERYTLFYSEVDTNLEVGDRVFIIGGNYDSDTLFQKDKFNKSSDGYTVLFLDKTKIVLDIPFDGTLPYIEEPVDNFIKVYVASSQEDFDYFLQTHSNRDWPYVTNRFASYGPYSNNNILYINGTFTIESGYWGILGFTNSGSEYLTYSNSFLILAGTTSGYLQDITNNILTGVYSRFLSSEQYSNRDLKIMNESFTTTTGVDFKKGYPYKWCKICQDWRVDKKYLPGFITEQNFRNGIFKKGKHNQGLLGNYQQVFDYNGEEIEFNLGTILNVTWNTGDILSGTKTEMDIPTSTVARFANRGTSYITQFDEYGLPAIRFNGVNNNGLGYNFAHNSTIYKSNISNGTYYDCIFGLPSTTSVVQDNLLETQSNFDVNIIKGDFINSKLYFSNIQNSNLFSSQVINSYIYSSKSINSEFEKSVFDKSKFTSDKIIKLSNYDERTINWWYNGVELKNYKLYKFYTSQKNFERLVEFQNFYFDGIDLNIPNLEVLNFFDDKFSIDSYKSTYDEIDGKKDRKVIVQLTTADENAQTIDPNDISFTNSLITNTKEALPSIDLLIYDQNKQQDFTNTIDIIGDDIYIYNLFTFELNLSGWGVSQSVIEFSVDTMTVTFSSLLAYQDIYNGLVSTSYGNWTFSSSTFTVQGTNSFGSIVSYDLDFPDKSYTVYPTQNLTEIAVQNPSVLSINRAYLVDSDFKSGIFKNSDWLGGNNINYNLDHSFSTKDSSYYNSISLDSSSGYLDITLGTNLRRRLLSEGDVVFFNRLEIDTAGLTAGGITGSNLVRLTDTFKIDQLFKSTNTLRLVDFINGSSSTIFNIPSFSSEDVLKNTHSELSYGYAHPVKFLNSKIHAGIFRRTYFAKCTFDNIEFDVNDKDPKNYDNWRRLLVADGLFAGNLNKFNNGLLLYSSWVSGNDIWENGIIQNSIWNVQSYTYSYSATSSDIYTTVENKFKNGIFRQSRWVNGTFENGLFYKNNSNSVYTTSVFSDNTDGYYRYKNPSESKTRWAWLDGIFEDGIFELSNFENGLFENGQFYNSTFLDGIATGGNFGRTRLDYKNTRVGSGTFSDVIVNNANFSAENPTGQLESDFSINWLNGVFNNGVFGVRVESGSYSTEGLSYSFNSYWNTGIFNNGTFQDIAIWRDGTFNNGKFLSYYGYPFIITTQYPTAPSQSFAWQGGKFNNGEFGNAKTGTNSTWYDGEFNGGIFTGRYWNGGIFTKGSFIGSGTSSTSLSNVSNFASNFSESYYGLWNNGIVNESVDKLFKDKKIVQQTIRRVDKRTKPTTVNFKNILWRDGTFSHGDGVMNNSIWTGGVFENGQFVNSSFNPYLNYLVNGDFKSSLTSTQTQGSLDYWQQLNSDFDENSNKIGSTLYQDNDGIFSKKLLFAGTSSLTKIYQTTGLSIGDSYKLRVILNSNENTEITYGSWIGILRNGNFSEGSSYWLFGLTESNFSTPPTLTIATGSPGYIQYTDSSTVPGTGGGRAYIIYPNVLEVGKNYELSFFVFNSTTNLHPYTVGSCDSSQIEILDDYIISTDFITDPLLGLINASFSNSAFPVGGSNKIVENFTSAFTDLLIVIDTAPANPGESLSISGINLRSTRVLFTSNATQSRTLEASFTADGGDFAIEFLPIATGNISSIQTYATSYTDIKSIELIRGDSGFNLSDSCVWYNGRFINSEFHLSKWYNGRWISGTATGMIWKNGIANYMNAYNVYWEGGLWRNGNWNGSPFGLENITEDGCIYSYATSSAVSVLGYIDKNYSAFFVYGYGFGSSGGFSYSVPDNNPGDAGLQPEIDPNDDSFGIYSVYSDGYFYTYTSTSFTPGKRYKITITLGTFSVPDVSYKDRPAIYFSLGKPRAANPSYGDTNGSLYPSNSNIATGASNISKRYQIDEIEGANGSTIPDFYTPGTDGYQSISTGTITEILDCIDDGKLYLHFDLYGSINLYIDEILVEEEICTQTGIINGGYASDILTNIARYRQDVDDSDYRALFLNNAFVFSKDLTWPGIKGAPNLTNLSFTCSTVVGPRIWNYIPYYRPYEECPIDNTISFSLVNGAFVDSSPKKYGKRWSAPTTVYDSNFYNAHSSSARLYAVNINNSLDIFSQSGEYQIKLKYWCSYDGGALSGSPSETTKTVKFHINMGYDDNVEGNGGIRQTITEVIEVLPVGCSTFFSGVSTNNFSSSSHGQTNVKTVEFTFSPLAFAEYSTLANLDTTDSFRFSIEKFNSSTGTKLHILYLSIENTTYQYASVYNNENCPDVFSTEPQFGETLPLPSTISYRGGSSNGVPISIRYGNGVFTSGLRDSFSSIWENGVWNEGLRYDKYVVYFENFVSFSGTSKPMSYPAVYNRIPVKFGQLPNIYDNNVSSLKPSFSTYTIALYTSQYKYIFEDGFEVDQNPSPEDRLEGIKTIRNSFKIGDKVAVGNISALDTNGIRRLIKDYWTIVDIISPEVYIFGTDGSQGSNDLIYLQITLNFSARIIQKDSENHPIYVSKNVWLGGAFLNGKFRGVWNNGLFRGRPYITRMVDSQWIDGIFYGGRFRGKTVDYLVPGTGKDGDEFATFSTNSGLIQNFSFNDADLKNDGYVHSYNSWIDVNYFTSSTVTIGRNETSYQDLDQFLINFSGAVGEYSLENFYSSPTKDVLSSTSVLRNHGFSGTSKYSLGWKINEYDNYLEEIGEFNNYYNTTAGLSGSNLSDRFRIGLRNFINDGWTYSSASFGGFVSAYPYDFVSNKPNNIGVLELKANNLIPYTILDNTNITNNFKKLRYSYVSFDYIQNPTFSFSRLTTSNTQSPLLNDSFLNLNERRVTNIKEYFFNRRGLDLLVISLTLDSPIIDNLKFVQTNSIPFIFLGTESRITQKVQVPLGSVAPPIDYNDSNFSLIDSLIITETAFDSISVPSVVITPSGPGSLAGPGKPSTEGLLVQSFDRDKVPPVTGGGSPFNPGQSVKYGNCVATSKGNSG